MNPLPEHVQKNRALWTKNSVHFYAPGRRAWAEPDMDWGIWSVPEKDLRVFEGTDFADKDVVELGCGTAYFSAWFAKLGAKPVGIDVTPAQIANARGFQEEFGIRFPIIEATAEDVPLRSESFDIAFSEYGASIWCDPYRWIPEAARLLRPGGILVFLRNATLSMVCMPDSGQVTTSLQRDWTGLKRMEWADEDSVEFHLPPGEMIRLLVKCGFMVENMIDVFPPAGAKPIDYDYMNLEWAVRWPSEEIWRARKLP